MSSLLMESLGWALVHSLWQGALVALLLAVALATVGRRTANARYALACGALVLSLALPVASGWRHYSQGRAVERTAVEAAARAVAPRLAVTAPAPRLDVAVAPASEPVGGLAREEAAPASAPVLERVRAAVAGHLYWLVLAWVGGVGLCSGRMAAEWVKLRRLARAALPAPAEWQERLDALARSLGLGRAVRLLQSSAVDVPAAVGWLSPVVLLPVSALSGLSPRQLEMVLAHELAHIRRHDFAVNLAQVLVETLLFYHPAVRWVSHVIRVEREHCCDDVAVGASGSSVSYARALTALEALRVLPAPQSPAMSALGGSLPERVRRLISAPATRCSSRWVAGASVLTLASSLAVAAPLTSLVLGRAVDTSGPQASLVPGRSETEGSPTAPSPRAPVGTVPTGAPALPAPPAPPEAPPAPRAATPSPRLQAGIASGPMAQPPAPRAATPAPRPQAGVASGATVPPPAAPPVLALAPAPAPAPALAPVPAPAPVPRPALRDKGDDDVDERTTVGSGQPLSVDQLVALKVAGVTPARVEELKAMGYAPTVANLVQMGHAHITPEYVKEMNGRFGRKLDADTLVQLRHLGVTPAYIESLKAAGYSTDDPEDLVQARAVGVDEAYVRGLKAAGYTGLSLEDLSQLRAVGVDPGYIDALGKRGLPKLSADDLTQLRAMGVTPTWLDEMRSAGLQTKDVDELTQLRAMGVNPAFLRELSDAGLKDLSIDELIRLRAGGVDSDFIRKLRDSRSK